MAQSFNFILIKLSFSPNVNSMVTYIRLFLSICGFELFIVGDLVCRVYAYTQKTWSSAPWWVNLEVHNLRWNWHTINMIVAQHLRICLDQGSGIAPTYCDSTLGVYWTGLSEALTMDWSRRNNVILNMSWVQSTLNPRVVDERCALGVHYFDLFGETNNSGQHTLYLG